MNQTMKSHTGIRRVAQLGVLMGCLLVSAVAWAGLDYALEDLNPSSETEGDLVGPSAYPGQVTLHYFGHYS